MEKIFFEKNFVLFCFLFRQLKLVFFSSAACLQFIGFIRTFCECVECWSQLRYHRRKIDTKWFTFCKGGQKFINVFLILFVLFTDIFWDFYRDFNCAIVLTGFDNKKNIFSKQKWLELENPLQGSIHFKRKTDFEN